MRAADKWDSARFWSLFLALRFFLLPSRVSARPLAGNAHRWAAHAINELQSISLSKERCIYDPSKRYCKEFF
jgi:hypothetical protein